MAWNWFLSFLKLYGDKGFHFVVGLNNLHESRQILPIHFIKTKRHCFSPFTHLNFGISSI